jgi:hypothetical protein
MPEKWYQAGSSEAREFPTGIKVKGSGHTSIKLVLKGGPILRQPMSCKPLIVNGIDDGGATTEKESQEKA